MTQPDISATAFQRAAPVLLVIGFWWLATGATLALGRAGATRVPGLILATALGGAGLALVFRSRDQRSEASARLGFLGAALLWLWVAATFYAGWIVGPAPVMPSDSAADATFPVALLAIRATAYHELLGLLVPAAMIALHGRNPAAFQTLAAFWCCDKLARLNVFFGVVNPGTALLPEPLEFLGHYFGPPVNSWLLPTSVIGLVGIAGWRFWRARQSTEPFARQVAVLLGVLFALAALEHALLGVSWRVPLWDPFLHAR